MNPLTLSMGKILSSLALHCARLGWLLLVPIAVHAGPDWSSTPRSPGFEPSRKFLVAANTDVARDLDARRWLGNTDELLPPDQAFMVSISAKDANTLVAEFAPANGYYLYRDKFVFRVQEPAGIEVTNVALPRGEIKDDPFFGKTEVFHRPVQAVVSLERTNSSARMLTLYVKYQGCNEPVGVCYIPIEKILRVALPVSVPGD